jgi:hypothetical protein
VKAPMQVVRQACREPIQEMAEGDTSGRMVVV